MIQYRESPKHKLTAQKIIRRRKIILEKEKEKLLA